MIKSTLFLLLAVAAAMFVTGCCTRGQEGEAEAAVAPAGWVSAGGEPAPLTELPPATPGAQDAELVALRKANDNLMNKLAVTMTEKERLQAEMAAAPEPEVVEVIVAPAPEPKPVTTVEGVREILQGEAVNDLPVTMNPRGDVVITLPGSISFGSGKAALKSTAQARLRKLAIALQENFPGLKIRAEGHTDSDPIRKSKWSSNMELSEARAGAVEKYILRLPGFDESVVSSVGYGATRPVASNGTSSGKSQNRRVELVLLQ